MQSLLMILGILISLFSDMLLIAGLGDLFAGNSDTEAGVLVGIVVFFTLTMLGGVWLTYSSLKKKRGLAVSRMEDAVFKAVAENGGRITPFQLGAATELTIEEARGVLDNLCHKGFASVEVTDGGEVVYTFFGLSSGQSPIG